MALTVRNKIWLGTIFLFLLLLLTGGAGIYYTAIMKAEAKEVLQENYESLSYCHAMQRQVDSLSINYPRALGQFQAALKGQEKNITEPGERGATQALQALFERLKQGDSSRQNMSAINGAIGRVLELNMNAIHNKNAKAEATAERALDVIVGLVAIVFLIAFTFSLNFPSIVTNPIIHLAQAIKEVSNKNYKNRIRIDNRDEFGRLADAFNSMAERLEYFENSSVNKLMFEKGRAEAVINSLKDPSIGIDGNGTILFANFQALQLLGLKSGEIVGLPIAEVSKASSIFDFLIASDSPAPIKIVIDGRENYFIKEVIDVTQGNGNSRVIVLRNITPFKELDVAKTNFIATISHELKTPLAASGLSLKLLEDERIGQLSGDQKELIQNLKQDNQRILNILSELLNISQVEAGRIQLDVQEVSPALIVDSALATVAASAKDRSITIIRALEASLPMVKADAEKSTWVLNNFLTNAIKYSAEGSTINVTARQGEGGVVFSVQDAGPGIAAEYVPRLFERYFKVPGSKEKGTGLGLAISKDFIEAQKGKVWVASEPGNGSTFSFLLPGV